MNIQSQLLRIVNEMQYILVRNCKIHIGTDMMYIFYSGVCWWSLCENTGTLDVGFEHPYS